MLIFIDKSNSKGCWVAPSFLCNLLNLSRGLMNSILFTVPCLLTNQNVFCERAYDDEIGQKLVENEDTISSCSMLEGNARVKHVITENLMVYKITGLYEIRQIDSSLLTLPLYYPYQMRRTVVTYW